MVRHSVSPSIQIRKQGCFNFSFYNIKLELLVSNSNFSLVFVPNIVIASELCENYIHKLPEKYELGLNDVCTGKLL